MRLPGSFGYRREEEGALPRGADRDLGRTPT
jgi:hypothetical protein